jgi:MFS family permease
MSGRLLLWAVTSALAGFLFGFDTVVISGAEQRIQKLWSLSAELHGVAMASALYGTVVGSLFGGWPTDRFGRKTTLFWIGILYVVSAFGCGFAPEVWSFIAARFLGGVGIGISTVVAPLYISEIAPPAHRGRLAGMFQFNIVFGIVMAFASNAALVGVGLPADLLERRPDVRVARQELISATARIGVAEAAKLPQLSISGNFYIAANNIDGLGEIANKAYTIGPALWLPLFTGGQID